MKFDKIERAARQIESMALLLQNTAERGDLDTGESVSDLAEIIREKATFIRQYIDDVKSE